MKYTPLAYNSKWGNRLCERTGIYGGYLNRRRRATPEQLKEWIIYYQNKISKNEFCPKRGVKIIAHFERLLERAE